MTDLPLAEKAKYWKTGSSAPDRWIDRALDVLEKMGATKVNDAFGRSGTMAAYRLEFVLAFRPYRIVWPVLPTRKGTRDIAAKRQAATALFHHLDAMFVASYTLTPQRAMFAYEVLANGQTAAELRMSSTVDFKADLEALEAP